MKVDNANIDKFESNKKEGDIAITVFGNVSGKYWYDFNIKLQTFQEHALLISSSKCLFFNEDEEMKIPIDKQRARELAEVLIKFADSE